MTVETVAGEAERLSRKRSRMLPILAIFFLSQQAAYFSNAPDSGRPVDHVRIAAWLALSIVLLLVLATGGGWFRSKEVRRLANDESTRAYRADAFGYGFFAAMITCIVLYFVSLFETLTGREGVHLVMTIGIATALIRFGFLERRALRDG